MCTRLQEQTKETISMNVVTDENSYVKSYAIIGTLIGGIDVEVDKNDLEAFQYVYDSHKVQAGKLVLDNEKLESILNEEKQKTREEQLQEQINQQQKEINELKEMLKGVISDVRTN